MGLAPYFSKAALGASALMADIDHEQLRALVEPLHVRVAFTADAAQSREGRFLLELTVNLLARFYPTLQFDTQGTEAHAHTATLRDLATAVNPNIDFADPTLSTPCIAIGQVPKQAGFCVFVGSDDWVAHLSTRSQRTVGLSENPFGAGAAACFGAAFLFRHYFGEHLGVAAPDQEFALSMASYEVGPPSCPNLDRDLGEFALVGIGAIGNAAVWALARTACKGTIHLIDHETVDETNPQRYILTTQADHARQKVDLAAQQLAQSCLIPHQHPTTWAGFLAARQHQVPRLVACALDTAEDRCALQSSLPEFILNAWTQTGDLGVSRHEFLGENACLACLYWPRTRQQNLDELVKNAIRYTGALMDVRNMLYLRTPIDNAWLDRISQDMGVERSALEPFRNKTLDEFYREGICGGHVMAVQGTNIVVPMAFQSALAGIMLAAEMVKTAATLTIPGDLVTTKIDLLRPIGTHLSEKAKKPTDINCICRDKDYITRYQKRHPHRRAAQHQPSVRTRRSPKPKRKSGTT